MKIYKPTDIFNFGKYKDTDILFIFTFEPKYIEWLIINNDHFAIDLNDFKDLHTFPMDISGVTSDERFGFVTIQIKGETEIRQLTFKEYLKDFYTKEYSENYLSTPSKIRRFEFSEKALTILKNKLAK